MSGLIEIAEPANAKATHRVIVEFADDHNIDGAKFDVSGVTAEQLFVAVAYLSRIANQMIDARMLQSAQGQAEIRRIRDQLTRERKGS